MKRTISQIDRALKSLYNLDSPLSAEDFLLAKSPAPSSVQMPPGMLFIEPPSEKDDSLGLGIYLGPEIGQTLNALPESGHWNGQQLAAFGVAVEEVSHFHYVAHFAPQGRGVSQLELEFQGEIDKFLLTFFARIPAEGNDTAAFEALMEKFFVGFSWFESLSAEEKARYEAANRLAKAFLMRHSNLLCRSEAREKFLRVVRVFYRLSLEDKINRATR